MNDRMIETECGTVRELIPDFVAGRLAAAEIERVERHVQACAECFAERELAHVLLASRASVPQELLERIMRNSVTVRGAPARTWWGVSAAAIAALALGIGITSDSTPEASVDVPGFAHEAEEGEIWLSDDGLLAGAPALDELSDEALLQLLDELTVGSTGGAA
jgi:anti-sigma factor RsiW